MLRLLNEEVSPELKLFHAGRLKKLSLLGSWPQKHASSIELLRNLTFNVPALRRQSEITPRSLSAIYWADLTKSCHGPNRTVRRSLI